MCPELCSWKKHLTSSYTAYFLAHSCQQHLYVALNSEEQLVLPIACLRFSNYLICSTKKVLLLCVLRPSQLVTASIGRDFQTLWGFCFELASEHTSTHPNPFPSFKLIIHICSLQHSLSILQVQQRDVS